MFPSIRSIEELGKLGLEEERRLAYVALTRAKKNICITYVNQSRYSYASHDYNMPSRFIDELPNELVEIHDSNYFEFNNIENNIKIYENENNLLTPGKKRLLQNYQEKEKEIDWDFNQDFSQIESLKKGTRVFHQKFGYGKIVFIEGDKAEVKFDKSSRKQVFVKYLEIKN